MSDDVTKLPTAAAVPGSTGNDLPALDPENPASIVALVESEAFHDAVMRVTSEDWELEEHELAEQFHPTKTDWALKVQFWCAIRKAATGGPRVQPQDIYGGICAYHHWVNRFLKNRHRVAWILSPLHDYLEALESTLYVLQQRTFEVASASVVDPETKRVDLHLAKLQQRIRKELEDRKYGTPLNRHAHAHGKPGALPDAGGGGSGADASHAEIQRKMAALDAKIMELQAREAKALHLSPESAGGGSKALVPEILTDDES
jgi:hypothetical protein